MEWESDEKELKATGAEALGGGRRGLRIGGWEIESRNHSILTSFVLQEWHAVASWTWDAQDETCGICRMDFDGCCPDCKLPGDDCPLIWGSCNHAFHLHCILKWVNSQTPQAHCPMCRREWQFKG
ncbi:hypothetical protein BUALT_Bualt19G0078200 [Buddleja alternifolia]|uniref:Anaphase-promoting complex subunit 11 n=1 Tax=Buddleja alternifolia TaxID=168488 RepID=A0AAV6W1Y2_9LAMI|nr:hypothetical protein BUALT_Bualt19G0078200 [Buddleja alternifolia]